MIAEETGRAVSFHDETLEEAYESRRRWEAPDWQYDAWVSTYTAIKVGEVAAVTDDVRRVTGHPPLSLRALLAGDGRLSRGAGQVARSSAPTSCRCRTAAAYDAKAEHSR